MANGYVISGTDLRSFVDRWLDCLNSEHAEDRAFLLRADREYQFGAHFLMANIAPIATSKTSSREVLLLFAVLSIFQFAGFPGRSDWTTPAKHVDASFAFASSLGEREMAHRLLVSVASERQYQRRADVIEFKRKITQGDAGRLARHEAKIEATLDRSVRAARLLGPGVSQARARAAFKWSMK